MGRLGRRVYYYYAGVELIGDLHSGGTGLGLGVSTNDVPTSKFDDLGL